MPTGGGGEFAGARDARSTPTASITPARASSRMRSPSRTRASGPSGRASGETWIAAGTFPLAPGHSAVGDQRDLMATVLEHAERRGELVQLGHAVSARTLEPHHHRAVAVEFARLERVEDFILVGEAAGRRFDRASVLHRPRWS